MNRFTHLPAVATVFLALILAASARNLRVTSRALAEGQPCSSPIGAPAGSRMACGPGLMCVYFTFGMPARGIPAMGTCGKVPSYTNVCSVANCGKVGFAMTCITPAYGMYTTCGAWAKRADGGYKPHCNRSCPTACSAVKPISNLRKTYCNECVLKTASCHAKFFEWGPIDYKLPLLSGLNGPCTTSNAGKSCKSGLDCAVYTFGKPAYGQWSWGICKKHNPNIQKCSIHLCATNGAAKECITPFRKERTTCGSWAKRQDLGCKPDCAFSCRRLCDVNPPKDNKGISHCNKCTLYSDSCKSNFEIFGTIGMKPKTMPFGMLCSTKHPMYGPKPCKKGLTCVLTYFGYPDGGSPNSGMCKYVPSALPACNTSNCAIKSTVCKTADTMDITTCGVWKTRSDGGM